jgi:hypothetical protein
VTGFAALAPALAVVAVVVLGEADSDSDDDADAVAEAVGPALAGTAVIPLNVAEPTDPAARASLELCAGSASIEIWGVPEPGAAGGQDLTIDVTVAVWVPGTAAGAGPGRVA